MPKAQPEAYTVRVISKQLNEARLVDIEDFPAVQELASLLAGRFTTRRLLNEGQKPAKRQRYERDRAVFWKPAPRPTAEALLEVRTTPTACSAVNLPIFRLLNVFAPSSEACTGRI